jgi:ATP-citrate lyase beta-subunit
MSRVKLSEYRAKKILIGDSYSGIQVLSGKKAKIPKGRWVAKVDQGIKKRFKLGLVAVDKPAVELRKAVASWEKKGYSQFLLEPFLPHEASEEQYLSLERVREGIRILHAAGGGIDIEEHPEKVHTYVYTSPNDLSGIEKSMKLPAGFLAELHGEFEKNFFAFVEINPLVVQNGEAHLLDAAVLADSAGAFFTHDAWTADVVETKAKHPAEVRVEALAATTPASLKLSVINPDGALFFLLSGGGGSIVIADEAQLQGAGHLIGNYGEYSGGPTREETYLYAKEIIGLMLDARPKSARGGSALGRKALVIAGGVANFTDVRKTFAGIIDALAERAGDIRKQGIKVFVRRGGPNEAVGLEAMKTFLAAERLLGSVYGSDAVITKAVEDAIHYIQS